MVLAGPPGTQFLKPVVVSFHHCANLKSAWSTAVHGSETPADETPQWQVSQHRGTGTQPNKQTGVIVKQARFPQCSRWTVAYLRSYIAICCTTLPIMDCASTRLVVLCS